ncbi:MAG: hypothetical protein MUP17_05130 [candidate division Zixibacteria bacterium]|nr:hypothetical protein [candidate division Zixibacteria bacterium]
MSTMIAKYKVGDKFRINIYRGIYSDHDYYLTLPVVEIMTHDDEQVSFDEPQYRFEDYGANFGCWMSESELGEKQE